MRKLSCLVVFISVALWRMRHNAILWRKGPESHRGVKFIVRRFPLVSWLTTAVVAAVSCQAYAGGPPAYTYTNLSVLTVPSGYISGIEGVSRDGTQVVGIQGVSGSGFLGALLWNNPTSSAVNLTPAGFSDSAALATNGTIQVGSGRSQGTGGNEHALLWTGTAASVVDLNPAGFAQSQANAIFGNQEVGFAWDGNNNAMIWTGTSGSAIDLNPSGSSYYGSDAIATNGVQQVGYAFLNSSSGATNHAMLWNGSASSAVDLNPSTTNFSQALGTSGTQQVGIGLFGSYYNAMLWTGAANTAVDLNPSGYQSSEALATNGKYQVGYGQLAGGVDQALLWDGNASSWVDLSALIPGPVEASQALAIDGGGDVFGYAIENNSYYEVEWKPVPEPSSLALGGIGTLALLALRRRRYPIHSARNVTPQK